MYEHPNQGSIILLCPFSVLSSTHMNPLDLISGERVIELTKTLVEIPSETGKEKEIGDWMINFFKQLGLSEITRLPVEEAGDTVYAVLKGGDGPKMMLNFHIDTFDASVFRSAQYQVQITQGSSYHVTTLNVLHDGSSVYLSEFGTIKTGSSLATFDADIDSGNVRVRATPSSATSTVFKVSKTLTKV